MAPPGTVAVTLVAVADVTVAWVAPKNTMLLAAVVLKPLPVSVTTSPGLADVGLKDVVKVVESVVNVLESNIVKVFNNSVVDFMGVVID